MKAKALAIAGALSVVSIALPLSAKAQVRDRYDYIFTLTTGSFKTLCGLYFTNSVSTEDLHAFQWGWMNSTEDDKERTVMTNAADALLEQDSFKDCPLLRD